MGETNHPRNIWKISLRSQNKPVSPVCEKFGGGGHKMACGIKVKNRKDIDDVLKELRKVIKK